MRRWIFRFAVLILILVVLGAGRAAWSVWRSMDIGTAYIAKRICSETFVAGRDPAAVMGDDLAGLRFIGYRVDRDKATVTGLACGHRATVAYRPGLGCTLVPEGGEAAFTRQPAYLPPEAPALDPEAPWPEGDKVEWKETPPGVDREALDAAVYAAFDKPFLSSRNTRAVVVVYQGRIVAERYAPGFTKDTRLLGWSMTKSVLCTLIGRLVQEGRLNPDDPVPAPEWQRPGDPRAGITWRQMLNMQSGLEFSEQYLDFRSDVVTMLYAAADTAARAAGKPLIHPPGTHWSYSSGTTNILSRAVRTVLGGDLTEYWAFPRRALFDPLGMKSAVMEPDASGTFVASSYMYATARDWARFGLLVLQDGVWQGNRLLPAGWMAFCRRPVPGAFPGGYGGHFWLNYGHGKEQLLPGAPDDAFTAWGFEDKFVTMVPSRELVVVSFGQSTVPHREGQGALVGAVAAAIRPPAEKEQ